MSGTDRYFQNMLNEYLPNKMMAEELVKRNYVWNKVEKDANWKGSKVIVPFRTAGASSVKFGGLTGATDIGRSKTLRGSIDDYVEVWGSLILDERDLIDHQTGKITENTFMKLIPDELDMFMESFSEKVSVQLTNGPHFSVVVDETNSATGVFGVSKVDRFELDQKAILDDNNSVTVEVYVIAINQNVTAAQATATPGVEGYVTFSLTRGGAAANLSAYTIAQAAKFYHDGVWDGTTLNSFTSISSVLLSQANGGSANVHGQSKLAAPVLQAINIPGSSISATNILDKLFDAYVTVRSRAKGNASEYIMSYKNWGSVMKALEAQKGGFVVTAAPQKSLYGWTTCTIASTKSGVSLDIVGVQEMNDSEIFLMDWKSVTFRSNGLIKKRKSPEGLEYHVIRNTTGYQYVIDICLFGEQEYRKPGHSAIIFGISY